MRGKLIRTYEAKKLDTLATMHPTDWSKDVS